MATIAHLAINLSASTGAFSRGMSRSRGSLQAFTGQVSLAVGRLLAFGAAFVGIRRAMSQLNEARVAADRAAKLSASLGVTVQQLYALQLAAELSGVENASLDKSLQKMLASLGDAARLGGNLERVFRDIGLESRTLLRLPTFEVFENIIEAIRQLPTAGERVSAARAIFGRAGADLIVLMDEGSEGLRRVTADAERFGNTLGTEVHQRIEALNDSWTRLTFALGSGARQVLGLAGFHLMIFFEILADAVGRFNRTTADLLGLSETAKKALGPTAGEAAKLASAMEDGAEASSDMAAAAKKSADSIDQLIDGLHRAVSTWETSEGALARQELRLLGADRALLSYHEHLSGLRREQERITSARQMIRDLEDQVLAFGKTGRAADLMRLQLMGAPFELREQFKDLDAMLGRMEEMQELGQFGQRMFEQTRTPVERFREEIKELDKAILAGVINWDTYFRALDRIKEQLVDIADLERAGREVGLGRQISLARDVIGGPGAAREQVVKDPQLGQVIKLLREIRDLEEPRAFLAE